MGAAFKLTDAIDENIVRKLKLIGTEAETTASSYAKLVVEMGKMQNINPKGLTELEEKAAKYNETAKQLHDTQEKLNKLQREQKDIYAQVAKQIQEQVKQEKEKAKLEGQILANENKRLKNQQLLERQNRKTAASQEDITRALSEQVKTVRQASEQNRILRQAMRDTDLTAADAAEKMEMYNNKIMQNEELLDKNSDAMIRRKRNIGNYASAWNGLGMSVQQLARELPSLSVGFSTFFLAISNNLPILADEIQRARLEFQLMTAAGKKATPVWKQLTGAIFSWQTALIVGVTVLSMYGKEIAGFVSNMFKGEKAINAMAEAEKALQNARVKGAKESAKERAELDLLYKASQDTNRSMDERNAAIDELQNKYPKYFGNMDNEAILAGKAKGAYENLTKAIIANAKAKAIEERITEEYSKTLDIEIQYENAKKQMEMYKSAREKVVETQKLLNGELIETFKVIESTGDEKADEIIVAKARGYDYAARNAEKYNKQLEGRRKLEAELMKLVNINDLLIKTDDTGDGGSDASKQLDIEKELAESRIALIKEERERELAQYAKTFEEKMAQIEGNSEKEQELRENLIELRKRKEAEINKKYDDLNAKEEAESIKRKVALELSNIESIFADKSAVATSILQEELNSLSEQYAEGLISKEEYEKKKFEITEKYGLEEARLAIELMEMQLEISALSEEEKNALQEKLSKARIKLMEMERDAQDKKTESEKKSIEESIEYMRLAFDEMEKMANGMIPGLGTIFDGINDIFEKIVAKEKITVEDILTSVATVAQGLNEFIGGIYQQQIDKLEEEEEALQEHEDREIERIEKLAERGAITQEEAEARKRAAEERTAQKEEEIAKKKAALQTKQAKLEKATNIITTIMNTAVGIMKAFAQGGIYATPIAAMIGAMGAIQLATIIAQPIPKYAKGTKSHKGGLALVGDGGVSETVITDKGMYLTPDTPTLVDLPKGAQVIPYVIDMNAIKSKANDMEGLMAYRKENELPPITIENDYSGLQRDIKRLEESQKKGFKTLAKAINNQDYKRFVASI